MSEQMTKGDRVKYTGPGPLKGVVVRIDQRTASTRFRVIVDRDDGTTYAVTTDQTYLVRQ